MFNNICDLYLQKKVENRIGNNAVMEMGIISVNHKNTIMITILITIFASGSKPLFKFNISGESESIIPKSKIMIFVKFNLSIFYC